MIHITEEMWKETFITWTEGSMIHTTGTVTEICITPERGICTLEERGICTLEERGIFTLVEKGICTLDKKGILTLQERGICTLQERGICTLQERALITMEESGICTLRERGILPLAETNSMTEILKARMLIIVTLSKYQSRLKRNGKNSKVTGTVEASFETHLFSTALWSIQRELERDRERELNQYQWVLRYYITLLHCNGNWTRTGNLGNWFPTHSGTYMVTLHGELGVSCTVNLYVHKFQFPLQCERSGIILIKFPFPFPVP